MIGESKRRLRIHKHPPGRAASGRWDAAVMGTTTVTQLKGGINERRTRMKKRSKKERIMNTVREASVKHGDPEV